MDERIDFVGQNFKYDQDKLEKLRLRIHSLFSDTMLKAFAINPELPKNLAFNTSIYTEEPFYKNEGMYEGSIQDLFIGCARDACVTLEVDDKMDADLDELGMRPFYDNFLMKLHPLYLNIETQGFKVNEDRRTELLKKYIERDEAIDYELFQIVGSPINTQSWKQVQLLIYHNWNIPGAGSTGEEVLTQILNSAKVKDPAKRRGIELILESRRIKKTIQTYAMALPDYDGRMRTTYFLCLKTGRTSTGQQDAPIRPTYEYRDFNGKPKKKALGASFQVMTKHGDIGQDIRSMYEADEGEVFIQGDSAQAEARAVALLADDYEALEMYDKNDIHALTASWFFGGTESDYSKKVLGYESPKRFAGKTLRHAGNLGATKKRAAVEINTQARKYKIDFEITEQRAGVALDIFHAKNPKIRSVFHAGVIKALEKNGRTLVAPLPWGIDAPHGGKRIFYERWGDELFREAYSYLPQRAISDSTKAAALRISKRAPWIRIILESHDSLLCSVPIPRMREAAEIVVQEMERPINFHNCSIPRGYLKVPCEIEYGYNYMELSKFKFEVAA
jgi:DNA polymerase I-like protein with 3'-5' exonuclease and polymerase domains